MSPGDLVVVRSDKKYHIKVSEVRLRKKSCASAIARIPYASHSKLHPAVRLCWYTTGVQCDMRVRVVDK
jgi:hypothetical protein